MKIEYSPESIHDLTRLREFIAVKNPKAAKRIAMELLTGIKKLKQFPLLGQEVKISESNQIRDLLIEDYIIRYLVSKEIIFILRVWHQKENWKEL